MGQKYLSESEFLDLPRGPLFGTPQRPRGELPFRVVNIDWDYLMDRRDIVMKTAQGMPVYMLKPEVLILLDAEKHPTYRLILDLMWSTGARVSEVLALRPTSFISDRHGDGVYLQTLKQGAGRPTKRSLRRSPRRFIPIADPSLGDRIGSYLYAGRFRQDQRIFPMTRQTVNRHIHALVRSVSPRPVPISAHTFRHSFAIHLLLHGTPLKIIAQFLGHKSVKSTEIYTNVLTADGGHFLQGVDFH